MITLTIVKKSKISQTREIVLYNSLDKARKAIIPIVKEMKDAVKEKRSPKIFIDGVSYDSNSEKNLLVELGALELTGNDKEFKFA